MISILLFLQVQLVSVQNLMLYVIHPSSACTAFTKQTAKSLGRVVTEHICGKCAQVHWMKTCFFRFRTCRYCIIPVNSFPVVSDLVSRASPSTLPSPPPPRNCSQWGFTRSPPPPPVRRENWKASCCWKAALYRKEGSKEAVREGGWVKFVRWCSQMC